jgi:uncharacterized damage-inducible protein DinB
MKKEFISQYKSSLKMLADSIKKCPDSLWNNEKYENTYWRIVYHTLFYTALYLEPAGFTAWKKHKPDYNRLGTVTKDNKPIIIDAVYSKNEMLEYLVSIYNSCEDLMANTNPEEQSGIEWLPMNKKELHLYNIRHIQHHVGQLIERLRQNGIKGIMWETLSLD